MNDETKAELMQRSREWLQSCVNAATRSGVPEEADLEAFILAHLDGEAARTAAAVAAAREEQREACALWMQGPDPTMMDVANGETVRGTPLTATPLADRIAELEARERDWGSYGAALVERAVKAEAERDRLAGDALAALAGAGVATPLEGYTAAPFLLKGDIGRLAAERDALRAQVEAARAVCVHSSETLARDVLLAMDGAKP